MKKFVRLALMGLTLASFSALAAIDGNACVNSSDFCSCYQKDAVSNCQKLGGGGLCNKGMGGPVGLLNQTSGEIRATGGSLNSFCHGSIVHNILHINPDDCLADNGEEFNSNGSVKKPDRCGWNS